jgi:hypothetical protein
LPNPSVSACFSKLKAGKWTPERKTFALAKILTPPTPSILDDDSVFVERVG